MSVSRRQLLHLSLLAFGTSALSISTGHHVAANAVGVNARPRTLDLAHVPSKTFQSVRNSTFTVNRPGQKQLHLTLSQVAELTKTQKTEGFSLRFQGWSSEEALEQGTYYLSHPTLGEMTFFMVPGKRDRLGHLRLSPRQHPGPTHARRPEC